MSVYPVFNFMYHVLLYHVFKFLLSCYWVVPACFMQDIIYVLLYLLSWPTCFLVLYWFYVNHLCLLVIACLPDLSAWHTFLYTFSCMCTPLGFILRTRWIAFWQPLNLHVQIPERGTLWTFRTDSWHNRSVVVLLLLVLLPVFSWPTLEFSFTAPEHLSFFYLVNLFVNHTFAPVGDVIFL